MIQPTKEQIAAGAAEGRKFLANASAWGNSMVDDAEMEAFATAVLNGALNVQEPPKPKPTS